jgi:hypothetical protein
MLVLKRRGFKISGGKREQTLRPSRREYYDAALELSLGVCNNYVG